ncbi:MAG: triose-phosphate isomerase [bacterium]|nr:triose-phosphate isomerase [bacterium]
MSKRTPFIAGNWKMNLTLSQALELVDGIRLGLTFPGEVDVVVAPTFLCLQPVAAHLKESYIAVSAQDMYFEDSGAYTGECSAPFIRDAGADYVIIGHSERRQYFHETDESVNKKIKAAFKAGLKPIVCVGETLDQREAGNVESVIQTQIEGGLADLTAAEVSDLVIAYEPVWAIGTGKTASPEQAEEVHAMIRGLLTGAYGEATSEAVRILYGGSVKPGNSKELLALPNVDGALIGGASLKAPDFIEIIKNSQ